MDDGVNDDERRSPGCHQWFLEDRARCVKFPQEGRTCLVVHHSAPDHSARSLLARPPYISISTPHYDAKLLTMSPWSSVCLTCKQHSRIMFNGRVRLIKASTSWQDNIEHHQLRIFHSSILIFGSKCTCSRCHTTAGQPSFLLWRSMRLCQMPIGSMVAMMLPYLLLTAPNNGPLASLKVIQCIFQCYFVLMYKL
jgi:hypothetical protein